MGILSKTVGANLQSGGHGIQSSEIFSAVADQVDPTRPIQWTTSNPSVQWQPTTGTIAEADAAEKEAANYENAVDQGLRILKAEGKKQEAHARLVTGHRQYLGRTAQAHFKAASANRGLAGKLHGLREGYAQMGYSLERKEQTTSARVEQIKAKLIG